MTTTQIELLFKEAIQEKAIYNKLEGITRNTVFNWLNKRSVPTVGDMLNVLYQLKKVKITACENYSISGIYNDAELIEDLTGTKRLALHPAVRPNSNKNK